jgi:protein-tyrosine-phosphatase
MKTVIFACVHNAGRSQMATAFSYCPGQMADLWVVSTCGNLHRRGR